MSETNKAFAQTFYDKFQAFRNDFGTRLDNAASSSPSNKAIDALDVELAKQRTKLIDATTILPTYDQRQCELQLKEMETKLEELRARFSPKSKFAFKRRVAAKPAAVVQPRATATSSAGSTAPTPSGPSAAPPSETISASTFLRSAKNTYLDASTLARPDANATSSDLAISDLDRTVVNLRDLPGIGVVHVQNVRNSVLLLPHISGSILLRDLHRCVLVLSCHQFRMHRSDHVDVYLHILSNPIIEHSNAIRFAPLPSSSPSPPTSAQSSKHTDVQDFSLISTDPSPNWSILPEDERRNSWDTDTNFSGSGVDDYLSVSLPR